MDFPTAMLRVKEGETIRRNLWEDKTVKVTMHNGQLQIYIGDSWRSWIVGETDMYAYDWETIEEG